MRFLLAAASRALTPRIPKTDWRAVEQSRERTPRWKTALVLTLAFVAFFFFGRTLVWLHSKVPGLVIAEVALAALAWQVRRRRVQIRR